MENEGRDPGQCLMLERQLKRCAEAYRHVWSSETDKVLCKKCASTLLYVMKKKTALTGLMFTDLDIQVSYISNNNAKL